jgi:Mrp family chromosome partitioning ATPase
MEPLHYVRIFRRRLGLILALTVVGALLGLASTALGPTSSGSQQRYLAVHVLLDESTPDRPLSHNLVQTFLTVGEVPRQVADDVGTDPFDVTARTHVVADGARRTITVYGVGSSRDQAEVLATALAERGTAFLVDRERAEIDDAIERLENDRGVLEADVERIEGEIADQEADGDDVPDSQRRAIEGLQDDIAQIDREITALSTLQTASERLSTISVATGFPVSDWQIGEVFASSSGAEAGPGALRPTTVSGTSALDRAGVRTFGGGLAGLLGGLSLAVILARLDPRIRSKEEAEAAFGLPVLAEIPTLPRDQRGSTTIAAVHSPRSPTAEAYRAARSSLVFVSHHRPSGLADEAPNFEHLVPTEPAPAGERRAQTILVTSPGPGEGKTTSVANLTAVLAEAGFSVLAINCDFRKPRLHAYLGADRTPRRVAETTLPHVQMIYDVVSDSSRCNPAEVVAAQRQVIAAARPLFDIIVLDTAPMLTTNDATDVLGEVDLVVVCCRSGSTTREAAQRTVEALRRHEAPVAGCILVGADETPSAKYYYYYGETDGPSAGNGRTADTSRAEDTRDDRGRGSPLIADPEQVTPPPDDDPDLDTRPDERAHEPTTSAETPADDASANT